MCTVTSALDESMIACGRIDKRPPVRASTSSPPTTQLSYKPL